MYRLFYRKTLVNSRYAYLAQSVELSAVNRSVVGSSPTVGAIGHMEKRLNSPPFHGGIHGFESHYGHQLTN